jgi:CO dehydrogenase maturation factor
MRSVQTAHVVHRLAADIGVREVVAVANRVRGDDDLAYLRSALDGIDLIGALPDSDAVRQADREGRSPYLEDPGFDAALRDIADKLLAKATTAPTS